MKTKFKAQHSMFKCDDCDGVSNVIREWRVPWYPIEREDERRALLAELQRELDSAHPLSGVPVTAIGRRQDNDDVLFSLEDGRMAVVHLTWIGKQDKSPFPWTILYATAETFVQGRLLPDHREWNGAAPQ